MVLKSYLAFNYIHTYNCLNKKNLSEYRPFHFEKKITSPQTGNKDFLKVGLAVILGKNIVIRNRLSGNTGVLIEIFMLC